MNRCSPLSLLLLFSLSCAQPGPVPGSSPPPTAKQAGSGIAQGESPANSEPPLSVAERLALLGYRSLRKELSKRQDTSSLYLGLGSLLSGLDRCSDSELSEALHTIEGRMNAKPRVPLGGGEQGVLFGSFQGDATAFQEQLRSELYRPCAKDDAKRWVYAQDSENNSAQCVASLDESVIAPPKKEVHWSTLNLRISSTHGTRTDTQSTPKWRSRRSGNAAITKAKPGIVLRVPTRSKTHRLIYWLDTSPRKQAPSTLTSDAALIRELLQFGSQSAAFQLRFGAKSTQFIPPNHLSPEDLELADKAYCPQGQINPPSKAIGQVVSPPWETISIDEFGIHSGRALRATSGVGGGSAQRVSPLGELIWEGPALIMLLEKDTNIPVLVAIQS